ncbi:MAG: PQQ-binding-like beta-propeller repeat protein, partial [Phycisphaeraceae bacterium]
MVLMSFLDAMGGGSLGVVPVVVGPLQALVALLPGILAALGGLLLALFKPTTIKRLFQLLWAQKLAVVLIVGAVGGLFYFGSHLLPARAGEVGAVEADAADWPQFRGGIARRGWVNDGEADPVRGGMNWAATPNGHTEFYSSPTLVGNRVYIASAQVSMFNREGDGRILCLDADTGALVWASGPRGYHASFSSASVVGNRLAIGEGLHLTKDARFTVLDLDNEGAVLWSYQSNSHAESSPVIHEDRVIFGSGMDGYYCFELEPGADGEPVLVWHVPGDRYRDASGSPSVYEAVVYVTMGRAGGTGLAALDFETGEELWRVETPYAVFSGPTIAEDEGLVLIGMGTGDFVLSAEEAMQRELERLAEAGFSEQEIAERRERLGPAGEVWAIDRETGEVAWRFEARNAVMGQVAIDGERAYFGSRDGNLYSVSVASGEVLGTWQGHEPIIASPAVADEHVYVVTNSGYLYALEKSGLERVWDLKLGQAPSLSSPTVARGRVFVGTTGNGVLSVGETGEQGAPLWAGDRGGPGRSGFAPGALMAGRANYAWGYSDPVVDGGEAGAVTAPIAVRAAGDDGEEGGPAVFVALASAEGQGVARLSWPEGLNAAPRRDWLVETAGRVTTAPVLVGDVLAFVEGDAGDEGRMLRAVDAATGAALWSAAVAADAPGRLTATREQVLVSDADGLVAYGLGSGEVRWRAAVGWVVDVPFVDRELVVAAREGAGNGAGG